MAQAVLHFGDCSINIAARELLRGGERINLSPIVFDCIAYLIQHRERAVGRDELVAAVWGKASVSDAVMGKTILIARRVLGDTAEEQRYLRTVPRFGYRWGALTRAGEHAADVGHYAALPEAAPDDEIAGTAADSVAATLTKAPSDARSTSAKRRLWPLVAALSLLVVLAFAAYSARRGALLTIEQTQSLPDNLTVVLPVEVAAAPEDSWLRLGLMDLLSSRLRAAGVAVLPSDNVVRLVPTGTPTTNAIAAARAVAPGGRVITPLVRRDGARWIVRADMLDADGGTHAVEADADDAITAAGALADRLLDLLGRHSPGGAIAPAHLSQAELLQRIDAARLAGNPAQARALIGAADASLQSLPEVQLRLALIDLRTGAFEAARARLSDLAGRVPEESDAVLRARIENAFCIASTRLGQLDAGIRACDRAIALFETRELPTDLGHAYTDRGIAHELQRAYDLAGADYAHARIALTLGGDALGLTKVDGNESVLDMVQGRYGEAVAIQQRIAERFARFGMLNEQAASLNNQSSAYAMLLQPLDALRASDQAFALLPRVTDASVGYFTKLQRAEALAMNGRLGEARVLLDEVIATAGGSDARDILAFAWASEAHLDFVAGQPAAAQILAQQAVAALTDAPDSTLRATTWLALVRSQRALGQAAAAATELQTFRSWVDAGDDPRARIYADLGAAEQAAADGRRAEAKRSYDDALALAKRRDEPSTLAEVTESYGRFLLASGDLAAASGVIGLIVRYAENDFDVAILQARLYRALGRDEAAENAIAQARRLAGERMLPPTLTTPTAPSDSGKSSIGDNPATETQ